MLFFALGLDREVLRLFAQSLEKVAAGRLRISAAASAEPLIRLGASLFSVGVRLALPVVALLVMVDVALALLGRINSQLQLLSLAFPAKMLTALMVLSWVAVLFPRMLREIGGHGAGPRPAACWGYDASWRIKSGKTEQPTQQRLQEGARGGPVSRRQGVRRGAAVHGLPGPAECRRSAAGSAQFRQTTRVAVRAGLCPRSAAGGSDARRLAAVLAACSAAGAGGRWRSSIATVAIRLATTRFGFSFKKAGAGSGAPQPAGQAARTAASRICLRSCQAVLLLPLFLWAVYVVARDKLEAFLVLPLESVESGFRLICGSLMELFWKAAGGLSGLRLRWTCSARCSRYKRTCA